MHVYRRNKLPVVFSAYFDENKTIHDHDTRQKQDFHTYSVHSGFGKKELLNTKGVNYGMIYQIILKTPCSFTRKLKKILTILLS